MTSYSLRFRGKLVQAGSLALVSPLDSVVYQDHSRILVPVDILCLWKNFLKLDSYHYKSKREYKLAAGDTPERKRRSSLPRGACGLLGGTHVPQCKALKSCRKYCSRSKEYWTFHSRPRSSGQPLQPYTPVNSNSTCLYRFARLHPSTTRRRHAERQSGSRADIANALHFERSCMATFLSLCGSSQVQCRTRLLALLLLVVCE